MQSKIALITGGLGDIGTAIVKQLHSSYTKIIALDVSSREQSSAWVQALQDLGMDNIEYRFMDVCDFVECHVVIEAIWHEFENIDLLVNNAGITRDAVFYKMTKQQWDDVLRVNLDGMFNVTRPVVEYMREQEHGRIINISSINGQKGQYSQANYAASKAGVFGFTKSLAQELMSKNITVNSISPGYVNTRLMNGIRADLLAEIIAQIPAKRLAEPEEVAWAVEFLASDKSSYITGSNVSINGGLLMT